MIDRTQVLVIVDCSLFTLNLPNPPLVVHVNPPRALTSEARLLSRCPTILR